MEGRYSKITSNERVRIEEMINEGCPLTEIARLLGKDATSISREVKRNRVQLAMVSTSKFMRNPCAKRESCKKTGLCKLKWCKRRCARCEYVFCHDRCDGFVKWHCGRLSRWPHVCNRCKWYSTCPDQRFSYNARRADKIALGRASLSRKGLAIGATEAKRIEGLITPLLLKGQSPYHIWNNHRHELGISLATFYTYINAGLFGAKRMHLVRALNFRPRKKSHAMRDRRDFKGRTFVDYLIGMEAGHEGI
jgi:IS30 family transposase